MGPMHNPCNGFSSGKPAKKARCELRIHGDARGTFHRWPILPRLDRTDAYNGVSQPWPDHRTLTLLVDMPFENPVFDSLINSTSPVWTPDSTGEFTYARADGGWQTVADIVERSNAEQVIYFPDANVGILPESEEVWTRFRIAGLGLQFPNVILTSSAYYEWIDKADTTEDRALVVEAAMKQHSWASFFDLDRSSDSPYFEALAYYLRLFATRRAVAIPVSTEDARSSGDLMNDVVTKIGRRGVELARKGRKDKASKGKIDVNDEVHVLTAIWFAFKFKREVCIVTADLDCLEIYYKAIQIIRMHYVAWLSARAVFHGRYGAPAATMSDSPFFRGSVDLFTPRFDDCRDVLPVDPEQIPIHCIYVHNNAEVFQVLTTLDVETTGLLKTKGLSRGLSTQDFNQQNVHMLDLVGESAIPSGKYIAIAEDQAVDVDEMGINVRIGHFDVHNVVNCESEFRDSWFPQWER